MGLTSHVSFYFFMYHVMPVPGIDDLDSPCFLVECCSFEVVVAGCFFICPTIQDC